MRLHFLLILLLLCIGYARTADTSEDDGVCDNDDLEDFDDDVDHDHEHDHDHDHEHDHRDHGNVPRPQPIPRPVPAPRPQPVPRPGPAPGPPCPAGWSRFQRRSGGWCARVFKGVVTHDEAERQCRAHGAVLSSVESAAERNAFAHLGRVLMKSTSSYLIGSVRIGLRRSSGHSKWRLTDGNTSGMQGVVWSPGEPIGGENNCGQIWLHAQGGRPYHRRIHGQMFAMVCSPKWDDKFRGYVCGKRATR